MLLVPEHVYVSMSVSFVLCIVSSEVTLFPNWVSVMDNSVVFVRIVFEEEPLVHLTVGGGIPKTWHVSTEVSV